MTKLEENKLDKIIGGDSSYISGPIITAIVSIIKLIRDAGYDMGSGMRRVAEDNLCPLKEITY